MWIMMLGLACGKQAGSEYIDDQLGLLKPNILVRKSEGMLYLIRSGEVVSHRGRSFQWPVSFGSGVADGDKETEGDKRTPEGLYSYSEYQPESSYHGSLLIHYPNSEDALRALEDGRIDEYVLRQVNVAERDTKPPPMTTGIGGYILVHGTHKSGEELIPRSIRYVRTDGCVGMSNADIDELREELYTDSVLEKGRILILP